MGGIRGEAVRRERMPKWQAKHSTAQHSTAYSDAHSTNKASSQSSYAPTASKLQCHQRHRTALQSHCNHALHSTANPLAHFDHDDDSDDDGDSNAGSAQLWKAMPMMTTLLTELPRISILTCHTPLTLAASQDASLIRLQGANSPPLCTKVQGTRSHQTVNLPSTIPRWRHR